MLIRKFFLCFFSICAFSILSAQSYFPSKGADWQTKPCSDFDIVQDTIQAAIDFAIANEYSGPKDLKIAILKGFESEPFHKILGPVKDRGSAAGMIIKNGFIIAEWGDTKRVDMTFSVTKSYLSTVAGLALKENLIHSVSDPVSNYVWDGHFDGAHNSKIKWQHLLNQSSDWQGQLWGGFDWADRPPKEGEIDDWKFRKLNEPGQTFEYNDVRVNLLAYSLLQVWRRPLPQILKENIMDPIGASTTWRWHGYENSWTNVDGIKLQSVSGGGHSGGGMFINTQDQARFGLLFLNNGQWNGQQLISKEWISEATTPSKANSSYGYMWWLNTKGTRRHMKGISEDIFYAAGFGGNYIIVDKEHDLVVVLRWLEPSMMDDFLRKVLAAF